MKTEVLVKMRSVKNSRLKIPKKFTTFSREKKNRVKNRRKA